VTGDIVDRIDAVTGCHQCEGPLNGSVSDLFCSEDCQAGWHARRVGAQPPVLFARPPQIPPIQADILRDVFAPLATGFEAMARAAREIGRSWYSAIATAADGHRSIAQRVLEERTFADLTDESLGIRRPWVSPEFLPLQLAQPGMEPTVEERMRTALHGRRNRNTGPRSTGRAPRRIDPRRSR